MDDKLKAVFEELGRRFLWKNYNYVYLKTMLHKAKGMSDKNATLITGSSYALSGIKESLWNNAVNCSMSSQDLYYDFRCAYDVISSVTPGTYKKCFIVKGYYAGFHDISSSVNERERIISSVYHPIFKDAHNWETPMEENLWKEIIRGELTEEAKTLVENIAVTKMNEMGTYYSAHRARGGTVFDLQGRQWDELSSEERMYLGEVRASAHNKLSKYTDTLEENKEIFKDYVHFLHLNEVMPVFVIAPFTKEYNTYLVSEFKESVMELLGYASGEIHYVDFNQESCFEDVDFVDTDHLSEQGAQKMSLMLTNVFGR